MYEVLLESRAEKDLKKLPHEVFYRIIPKLKGLADDPKPLGFRKISGSRNDYRMRVGDYRIIYEVDETSKAVRIMRVRHRKEAYR